MLNGDMRGMRRRHRTSTAVLAAGLAVLVALVLGGCSNDDPKYKPGTLPPLSPSGSASGSASTTPTASPTGTQGLSDKEQVKAVYLGFIRHYQQAEDQPPARRRSFLAQWMTDPGLTSMTKAIDKQVEEHKHSSGHFAVNIISIKVSGSTATVDDCLDQRHFDMKDTRTGKVVGEGSDFVWTLVRMKHTEVGWRVSKPTYRNKSCVPH